MSESNRQKLLLIVIPLYNVGEFIANCLDTIVNQKVDSSKYDILIVNDGSTDNGPQIVERYINKHGHIEIVNQENQGLSAARNTGIAHSKAKYIYFLDSDDYITRNSLPTVIRFLEEYSPDVLTVKFTSTPEVDDYDSNIRDANNPKFLVSDGMTFIANNNYPNMAWWYFLRCDYLRDVGKLFPVGRICEDSNFTAEILFKAKKLVALDLDFYRYFERTNSITRKTSEENLRRMIDAYRSNILEFDEQLKKFSDTASQDNLKRSLERIRTRQESFVFFMLIRCLKMKMPRKELDQRMLEMKELGVYPMNNFVSDDFSEIKYRILTSVVNSNVGLNVIQQVFKLLPNFYKP